VNIFIDHSQVVTTNNCTSNTIADFRTVYPSLLSLLSLFPLVLTHNSSPRWLFLCSVITRSFLVTSLNNVDSSAPLARRLTLHSWTLNSTQLNLTASFGIRLSYKYLNGPQGKNSLYCWHACSPYRCVAISVLIFRAFASAGMCLATRCLAMDIHVRV
jgi:hypothetical protein